MRSRSKLLSIGFLAAVGAAIFSSIASIASACNGEYATFNPSPGANYHPAHRPWRIAALDSVVLKTLRGRILGGNCYVGRRPLTQMKIRLDGGFADQACVDSTKGGRYVTPVAVHGHCCA
jgi:hypothetical protein